jgi:hypothetical protein
MFGDYILANQWLVQHLYSASGMRGNVSYNISKLLAEAFTGFYTSTID